jgi:cytochrome bd-type quinol oxidase subunit 2
MSVRNSPKTGNQSNAATAIALFGLVLISAMILGLMALVLPELLGVLVVILIFAVPAALHYLIWGWWLSQKRIDEPDEEKIEDRN